LSGFEIFPNPTNGEFTIRFEMLRQQDMNIIVQDMLGKTIYNEALDKFSGAYSKLLDLTQSARGVYIVEIASQNQAVHKRLIVQ
jgi:hypothetical protein